MSLTNRVQGDRNTFAGRDIITIHLASDRQSALLGELFKAADEKFRQEVSASGKILRLSEEIDYSAEALFTSLMQIGLPADAALDIPFEIVGFLREMVEEEQDTHIVSTADIRIAVVRAISGLAHTGKFVDEQISMWASAYIRRYGNPENQFVKVIDNEEERDLNYEYIEKVLLPHLLNRILDLPGTSAPLSIYRQVFSRQMVGRMASEIITSINSLNLYAIQYNTLLHLLQDIILEPPHPWIVNLQTIEKVSRYNFERALHHIQNTQTSSVQGNPALLLHAYYEYFRHICATILSKYGAFLGVGERYGLLELKRIINLKNNNRPLWTYCRIHDLEEALCSADMDLNSLTNCLDRIWHLLRISKIDQNQFQSLGQNAQLLKNLVERLFPDLMEMSESKEKRSCQEQCP